MKWLPFKRKKNTTHSRKIVPIKDKIFGSSKLKLKKTTEFSGKVRKIYAPSRTTVNNLNTKNTKKISNKLSLQLFFSSLYFRVLNFPVIRFFLSSSRFFGTIFLLFFLYVCFIDTSFIIKNITIDFEKDSFLDKKTIAKLDTTIKNYRYFGMIPANSIWFANSVTLNQLAKEQFSEIQDVAITKTTWPNTATLRVKTKPILATLSINNNTNYIVISQNGTVLGKDNYNLRSNVITVNSSTNQFDSSSKQITLEPSQLEKVYFLEHIKKLLDSANVPISKQIISSLSEFDSITITTLSSGAQLLFDNTALDKEYLDQRINTILSRVEVQNDLKQGDISYIDFRSPGKVFLCKISETCALDNSIK